MHVIAHRGWSVGKHENSIKAFKKAVLSGVDGVEFDIRWSVDKKEVIISHDLENLGPGDLNDSVLRLEEGLGFLADKDLELWIEMKEYDNNLFALLVGLLKKYNLIQKTFIFGFKEIAEKFDWVGGRKVRLGIITRYPWNIKKNVKKYNPDSILIGWDERWWTKPVFKLIWSVFSFERLSQKYPKVKFVAGVVESNSDHDWISKQKGLHSFTTDNYKDW